MTAAHRIQVLLMQAIATKDATVAEMTPMNLFQLQKISVDLARAVAALEWRDGLTLDDLAELDGLADQFATSNEALDRRIHQLASSWN